jgi:hypothetical protein
MFKLFLYYYVKVYIFKNSKKEVCRYLKISNIYIYELFLNCKNNGYNYFNSVFGYF